MAITLSTPRRFRQPVLQYVKGQEFVLVHDYVFVWGETVEKRLTLPAGFNSDKASVPRILWPLFRPDGAIEGAALVHDYCYRWRGQLPEGVYQTRHGGLWQEDPSPWTRAEVDDLLEYMAVLGGVSKPAAKVAKWAVKINPVNWVKGF